MSRFNVGDKVKLVQTYAGTAYIRFGEVVEIGVGHQEGRVRVRWSEYASSIRPTPTPGKVIRTWYNPAKLVIQTEPQVA